MEVKTINDICLKVCSGGTPTSSVASYFDGDIPWLNTNEVNFCNIYSTAKHISEEGLKKSAAKYVPENTVIVAMYGVTAGRCAITKIPLTTNQACCNLIIDETKTHYQYVYYYLKLQSDFLNSLATGGAQQNLNAQMIKRFPIMLPSLPVQYKIASILSNYDALIDINTKRIKLLEESARELYKEWFVRMRFPGFEQTKFVKGIPEGWGYKNITDLLDIKYGKDHKALEEGDYPCYGSGGIMRYVDKCLFEGESVLIPRKGSLNNIMIANGSFWTIDTMFYTIPKMKNVAKYAYYMLSSIDMESLNAGAALPSMTTNILSNMDILLPSQDILEIFETCLSPMFNGIETLTKENQNLAATRDRLLPRLLSGELKVKA